MDGLTIMKRLGQGRTLEEWGEAIRSLAQEVSETGKPGKLVLSVEVKPLSGQGGLEVGFKETISRTPPKTGERGALLYAYEGDLYSFDPRQPQMPHFEMVAGAPVDTKTGEIVERVDDEKAEGAY